MHLAPFSFLMALNYLSDGDMTVSWTNFDPARAVTGNHGKSLEHWPGYFQWQHVFKVFCLYTFCLNIESVWNVEKKKRKKIQAQYTTHYCWLWKKSTNHGNSFQEGFGKHVQPLHIPLILESLNRVKSVFYKPLAVWPQPTPSSSLTSMRVTDSTCCGLNENRLPPSWVFEHLSLVLGRSRV